MVALLPEYIILRIMNNNRDEIGIKLTAEVSCAG